MSPWVLIIFLIADGTSAGWAGRSSLAVDMPSERACRAAAAQLSGDSLSVTKVVSFCVERQP